MEKYIEVIESAIEQLGVDIKKCRTQDPHKWHLHRGKAQVIIFLRESQVHTGDKRPTMVIVSPILPVPEEEATRNKLYGILLETSHKMITESFSTAEGWVYMSTTYYLEEVNQKEAAYLLDSLSYYAQMFTTELRKGFVKEEKTEEENKEA
ncbi:MAG: YbjN domain-containing protein [Aureispira sp.]|nr:YbjN domain-containing protein [Aureispira sp.]